MSLPNQRNAVIAPHARPEIVNGGAGVVVVMGGRPFAVVGFTVSHGRIAAIDLVADPARLQRVAVTVTVTVTWTWPD
jgi:hypothetical protein